jgi:ATP-binding cassette subfamily B protein
MRQARALRNRARLARPVILVTHSLSLATDADRVFVLSDGRLVEQGSHRELLAPGTLYSRLWHQRST